MREAGLQMDTAMRSAADTLSMGTADEIAAGADALFSGGVDGYRDRYEAALARELERDEYDEMHRAAARAIGESAATALLAYTGGYAVGKGVSAELAPVTKGKLGEALSVGKTLLKGDLPVKFQVRVPLSRGYTRADQATLRGYSVEAKFGPRANLRPRQIQAVEELGDTYRVDRWMPEDAGRVLGASSAPFGALIPLMDPEYGKPRPQQ